MQQLTTCGLGALVFFLLGSPILNASPGGGEESHVFVSVTGNSSMSVVRCKPTGGKGDSGPPGSNGISCRESDNQAVGFRTSWPANQYEGEKDWWWTGLSGEVIGLKASNSAKPLLDAENRMVVDTYTYAGVPPGLPTSGSNFIGVSPKGKTAWNAAREIDEIQEIDIDPDSDTFGQILTHIPVPLSADAGLGSATRGKMRPCDMSITPDNKYLWEPDIGGETVTGVDIGAKSVIAQITLPRENLANRVIPFMLTTNGTVALVENFEAPFGTESIIDVTDPANPVHVKKLTQADGLGVSPTTSEFTPDGKYAYIIANGSPTVPGEINVLDLATLQITKSIALPADCRPSTGDFTNDDDYFVVNCSGAGSVAVISNELQEVVQEVALSGTSPRGVVTR
jgi:DNA-binding beta-propeller fold protein YncE